MASLNRATIIGNLGKDVELRQTQGGGAVGNFSVATTSSYKDKDGKVQEQTEWHRVIVWGKTAENCAKYLGKGSAVYVEGRLQTRKWQDKNGADQYSTEIVAQGVQFLTPPGKQPMPDFPPDAPLPAGPRYDAFTDDIPF